MLDVHADLSSRQHALVEAERIMLAFLGHELRTDMQSAIYAPHRSSNAAMTEPLGQRLSRAVCGLQRANGAIVSRASGKPTVAGRPIAVAAELSELLDEQEMHARWRSKEFEAGVNAEPRQRVPRKAMQGIIANLLRNAIDHAGDRRVGVMLSSGELVVSNKVNMTMQTPGVGIGLRIAERLSQQAGWTLKLQTVAGNFIATIDFGNG